MTNLSHDCQEQMITDSMRLDWLSRNADVCSLEPYSCLNQGSKDMRAEIDKIMIDEMSATDASLDSLGML